MSLCKRAKCLWKCLWKCLCVSRKRLAPRGRRWRGSCRRARRRRGSRPSAPRRAGRSSRRWRGSGPPVHGQSCDRAAAHTSSQRQRGVLRASAIDPPWTVSRSSEVCARVARSSEQPRRVRPLQFVSASKRARSRCTPARRQLDEDAYCAGGYCCDYTAAVLLLLRYGAVGVLACASNTVAPSVFCRQLSRGGGAGARLKTESQSVAPRHIEPGSWQSMT